MTRDPVTAEVRDLVLRRDGGCVASKLDPAHVCRDRWGVMHGPHVLRLMTLDHVQEGYGMMGKRAPSDPAHLVSLCCQAHLNTNWATSHKDQLREYLRRFDGC